MQVCRLTLAVVALRGWKVPLLAGQEEQGSALLTGRGCRDGALDSDGAQVLGVRVDTEEKKTLSAGPHSGLFRNLV